MAMRGGDKTTKLLPEMLQKPAETTKRAAPAERVVPLPDISKKGMPDPIATKIAARRSSAQRQKRVEELAKDPASWEYITNQGHPFW
jgi:hypothetical protein